MQCCLDYLGARKIFLGIVLRPKTWSNLQALVFLYLICLLWAWAKGFNSCVQYLASKFCTDYWSNEVDSSDMLLQRELCKVRILCPNIRSNVVDSALSEWKMNKRFQSRLKKGLFYLSKQDQLLNCWRNLEKHSVKKWRKHRMMQQLDIKTSLLESTQIQAYLRRGPPWKRKMYRGFLLSNNFLQNMDCITFCGYRHLEFTVFWELIALFY